MLQMTFLNIIYLFSTQNIQNRTGVFRHPRFYSPFGARAGRHFFCAKESTIQLYQLSDFFLER